MKKKKLRNGILLLAAFVLWTAAVSLIDVRAIGPQGSSVGFATLNDLVHQRIGVHMRLYVITDWLGLVPAAFVLGFGLLGLAQWITRRSIKKVDPSLTALGALYIATLAVYLFFEKLVINCRPVLIDGILEPSYPSSTTVLVLCVMPTAIAQLRLRVKSKPLLWVISVTITGFTVFMVIGRLISGVHWLTDIIGGALLSAALVMLYSAVSNESRKDLL